MNEASEKKVKKIISEAKDNSRNLLTEFEAKQVLSLYNIPTAKGSLVKSAEEAIKCFHVMRTPVVMKIVSPDIIHKTDANCVILNLRDQEEVERSFDELIKNANLYRQSPLIQGVLIEEMVDKGIELIIGSSIDETFGPVIMFGLGGIFVETIKDVSFRAIPITLTDAQEMVEEIRGYEILKGTRGKKGISMEKLFETLVNVSKIVNENKEISEIDINPIIANENDVTAADARIILK